MTISFELPGLPRSMNGSHGNWYVAAAERKRWRRLSGLSALAAKNRAGIKGPWDRVRLVITRCSTRPMDFDNRVASAKPIVDGLMDARVIADDSDAVIVERDYRWERAERGHGKVRVEVSPIAFSSNEAAGNRARVDDAPTNDQRPQSGRRIAIAGSVGNPDQTTQQLCNKYTVCE